MDRFWNKVLKTNSCWMWTASKDKDGYGIFIISHFRPKNGEKRKKFTAKAHRFSFEITKGKIPSGLFVCHTCDNPSCVNPDHLFLGTAKDNFQDCLKKKRVFPFKGVNLSLPGEKNPSAKISEDTVRRIRSEYVNKQRGVLANLSRKFRLSESSISRIIKRQSWKHI